ncbi:ATP-dependent Clp protease proteolytic subunit-related protein 4, chloroplastic [Capsicum baccatum]|uniref:ATP-dependent Clp protease proteolytic subunit n=1 Tax=Capsicum baccatum TaxID=33114 RepID=A0A2G2XM13_CAPBA|nr:ATP-dependent Clp protease proteolytic subunit-related protein 4, chloroplastic [Capsicum baccatum]
MDRPVNGDLNLNTGRVNPSLPQFKPHSLIQSFSLHSFTFKRKMEAVTIASQFSPATAIRRSSPASCRSSAPKRTVAFSPSPKSSISTSFISPFVGGSVNSDFSGQRIRPDYLRGSSSSSPPKRAVVTMVIPFVKGTAWEQPPPDLASYLYKNRIVYLGMSLVPSVTELILAEFLYLQYEDEEKPIYLYINSTGTTKDGEKLGYETEAFAIYDVMRYVKPPIFTLCVGNAWGEAALLLAAGAKGNRAALPSSTIMIKQPIAQFQGQATDVELMRKEVKNVKAELVKLYAKHIGKSPEQIEEDIRRPKYFSPTEALEYGIIDKVLYNERGREDRGVVSDLKKAQLI